MKKIDETVKPIVKYARTLKDAASVIAENIGCDMDQAAGIALDIRAGIDR